MRTIHDVLHHAREFRNLNGAIGKHLPHQGCRIGYNAGLRTMLRLVLVIVIGVSVQFVINVVIIFLVLLMFLTAGDMGASLSLSPFMCDPIYKRRRCQLGT